MVNDVCVGNGAIVEIPRDIGDTVTVFRFGGIPECYDGFWCCTLVIVHVEVGVKVGDTHFGIGSSNQLCSFIGDVEGDIVHP